MMGRIVHMNTHRILKRPNGMKYIGAAFESIISYTEYMTI
jgi:hypothetical protein